MNLDVSLSHPPCGPGGGDAILKRQSAGPAGVPEGDTNMDADGAHILVVEDDADINRLLTTLLTKEGYTVTSAFSGSEAAMRLETARYDLVLLDLMLPGLTGEELLARIRRDQVMPVIVLSAKGREDKLRVLADGADDFIGKPSTWRMWPPGWLPSSADTPALRRSALKRNRCVLRS